MTSELNDNEKPCHKKLETFKVLLNDYKIPHVIGNSREKFGPLIICSLKHFSSQTSQVPR